MVRHSAHDRDPAHRLPWDVMVRLGLESGSAHAEAGSDGHRVVGPGDLSGAWSCEAVPSMSG
ncbi:hypothetical protein AO398_24255 [Methylobacterium sp. GXS13]|jgi:hypothetical protein|nr:hypothetical protein AO398_24255 [Methylobacterium sp. GXS13]